MNRLTSSHQSLKYIRQQSRQCNQQNKRQGDWVCMLCSNLNYSFRDCCNRCRNLTRQQNMKLSSKKDYIQQDFQVRQPLGELFFHRINSLQQPPRMLEVQSQQTPKKGNHSEGQSQPIIQISNHHYRKPEKTGFSSLLFLTPTRYAKDNCEQQFGYQCYKSPKLLPSVSPLLRSLKI